MKNINTYSVELDENRHPVLIVKEKFSYEIQAVRSPQDAVTMVNKIFHLNRLAEENVVMIALDIKGQLLGIFEVSHGTVNSASCNAREIFIRALIVGAAGVIVLHNHPSGISIPSDSDTEVAKKFYDAGKLIGIEILDFIVVGKNDYYSFHDYR
jgi:DNA repair protein RadC